MCVLRSVCSTLCRCVHVFACDVFLFFLSGNSVEFCAMFCLRSCCFFFQEKEYEMVLDNQIDFALLETVAGRNAEVWSFAVALFIDILLGVTDLSFS